MSNRYFLSFLISLVVILNFSLVSTATDSEVVKFECGTVHPDTLMRQLREAVLRGEIPDRSLYPPPPVPNVVPLSHDSLTPKTPIEPADLFLYEDKFSLLLGNFSNGQLFSLMTDAANKLIARDGDQWDFIAFWVNFTPNHQLGSAFHLGITNDVDGIGRNIVDFHGSLGLSGTKVQSYVMMWNMASWDADSSDLADFTQVVMGQEFEHRFGMFLPDLNDGRVLQGDDIAPPNGCGRSGHWNFKVDLQGSGMESPEWVGSSPAVKDTSLCPRISPDVCFNKDIGGVWNYTDLYLMGYVSAAEMDAGNSEMRYMNEDCASPYEGTISTFSSTDITDAAGERFPDANDAQHSFRTAWIVIHLPGQPPSNGQLERVAAITTKWTDVWHFSSLGRGFMDNHIAPPFVITTPSLMAAGELDFGNTFIPSLETTGFDVQVIDSAGTHDTTSGLLHYSVNGGSYNTAPLQSLGGGMYHAVLPALACKSKINYYVSFKSSDGTTTINQPIGAPTTVFSAIALDSYTEIFSDDFETDQGWTVGDVGDNATTGIWTRVDPFGTGAQPEDDNSDPGTLCFVTGQGAPYPGGVLGENDVDGGKTTVISPSFDLSGKDGVVRYARWFSNNAGANPGTQVMTISISSNNGTSWTVMDTTKKSHIDWVTQQFVVSKFVTPTNQMKVRFVATDAIGSLVEAGVDDFKVFSFDLNQAPVLDAIVASDTVNGDSTLSLRIHALDPDIELVTLTALNVPTNATFFDSGNGAASFIFSPDMTQAGVYNLTFIVQDECASDSATQQITVTACLAKAGDANNDLKINLTDVIFLVNYVFKSGTAPSPLCRGDANGTTGTPNLTDVIFLVNRVFKGGPAPVKIGVCCF